MREAGNNARRRGWLFWRLFLPSSLVFCPQVAAAGTTLAPIVEDRAQAVQCLALAVAYEAGNESLDGKRAVAEVVLNRLRDPAFPKSVCGVVFAGSTRRTGCQFTFTCDGSLRRTLSTGVMASARTVAEQALDGAAPALVLGATHYHAHYVNPWWAPRLVRLTRIGAHIFYRGAGPSSLGTPGALVGVASPAAAVAAAQEAKAFAPWGLALPAGR